MAIRLRSLAVVLSVSAVTLAACAYYTASYTLERTYARQLFSYPASTDTTTANTPVPDLATVVPTTANGGISADGRTYTIHLRTGVDWNTSPARPVTAQDAVLGLKRLCNPVSPVGAPGCYENTSHDAPPTDQAAAARMRGR